MSLLGSPLRRASCYVQEARHAEWKTTTQRKHRYASCPLDFRGVTSKDLKGIEVDAKQTFARNGSK